MNFKYELDDALSICREFESKLKDDFHVCLGGSCLINGGSRKDIDIFIYRNLTHEHKELSDQ